MLSLRSLTTAPCRVRLLSKTYRFSSLALDSTSTAATSNSPLSQEDFRKEHQIALKGPDHDKYVPFLDFDSTPFQPSLKKALKAEGFSSPTPIQAESWPIALEQRDIISIARTGSGKTCGFLLPAFHKMMMAKANHAKNNPTPAGGKFQRWKRFSRRVPTTLVLAPTRELAVQIDTEAQKFSRTSGLITACLYGGTSKGPQIAKLKQGVDIVVATPGRCNDLAEMGLLDLSSVDYLVLDEADRMLDMGFEPQIRQIIEQLPSESRQNLFFSATWPKEVQSLAAEFLNNPIQINIGQTNVLNANKAIAQHIIVLQESQKADELLSLLTRINKTADADPARVPKTLVFVARKSDCDNLSDALYEEGYAADSLHGDKSQGLRDRVMDKFRSGRLRVLVATDVAARGLDVRDVECVINYDFPVGSGAIENYVHRIGRTGRGNATGEAYTFFTKADAGQGRELIELLQRSEQTPPPELVAMVRPAPRFNDRGGGNRGRGGGYGFRPRGDRGGYGGSRGGGRGGGGGGYGRGGDRQYRDRDDSYRGDRRDRGSRDDDRRSSSRSSSSSYSGFKEEGRGGGGYRR